MPESVAVKKYWENVSRATQSGPGIIIDNFPKRRLIIEALLKYPLHGASIVELGSGNGITGYSVGLANGKLNYTGVDISEVYAKVARENFNLNIVVCDMTFGLPFPEKSCDAIFAFDVLEHIHHDDRQDLFKEMNRILREDRIIFINNPLSESKHDPDYDFHLDERDIADLCVITGTKILEVKLLQIEGASYQFIVLGKI